MDTSIFFILNEDIKTSVTKSKRQIHKKCCDINSVSYPIIVSDE